jgi:predicted porin
VVRLAGYYDLAGWRLSALWQTIAGTVSSNDEDVYGIGVRYGTDAWAFKTQAYQLDSNGTDMNATLAAVGAEYALHKAIILYADYAMVNNDARQTLTPYKEGHSDNLAVSVSGDKATGISLGTIIKF